MESGLEYVDTSDLKVAYRQRGDPKGDPVLLVHGWPDDASTWDPVIAKLAEQGRRTIAPYLRGFGPTHFLSSKASRTGQLTGLAQDLIEFTKALKLQRFLLVGHDWGARAAYILSALHPELVRGLVALSVGYGTNDPNQTISYAQSRNYWYHWFFATPRGQKALESDRHGLCRFLWHTWSPNWRFTEEEFKATSSSWENPDWVDVTLHSYRHRWGHAPGEAKYVAMERKMAETPRIAVPTIVIQGSDDGANLPETTAGKERFFTQGYDYRVVKAGHFIQREDPECVVRAAGELLASSAAGDSRVR